jgi:hypothetical protein
MRHFHRMHGNRGALEGLPLYLIILIVVAAIVVAILVGWLTTLQHPAVNSLTYGLSGGTTQTISDPTYPNCGASSGAVACFTPQSDGSCLVTLNAGGSTTTYPGTVLVVTTSDKNGHALGGVTVTISAVGWTMTNVQPGFSVTTGQSGFGPGDAAWTTISGSIPPDTNGGASISISASYSNGGVTSTQSAQVTLQSPTYNPTTNSAVSC